MSPHGFFGLVPLRPTNEISGWAPPWLVGWVGARERPARASDASIWLVTTTEFLSLVVGELVLAKVPQDQMDQMHAQHTVAC